MGTISITKQDSSDLKELLLYLLDQTRDDFIEFINDYGCAGLDDNELNLFEEITSAIDDVSGGVDVSTEEVYEELLAKAAFCRETRHVFALAYRLAYSFGIISATATQHITHDERG